MDAIRAFIAIELPQDMQTRLAELLHILKQAIPYSVRWVPPGNIHLTLKFLGESSPNNIALLSKNLPTITSRHHPFDFHIGGLGAFPNLRRPRVIWVGIQAPSMLGDLQRSIEREMQLLGYAPEERPFSPHLTLGRVNQNATPEEVHQISSALSKQSINDLGRVSVKEIILFRSELLPNGARYTPLVKAHLNKST
jgi:2'-5' RNA ligase